MSDANRTGLAWKEDTGMTQPPAGDYQDLPRVSDGMKHSHQSSPSAIIRSDRQVAGNYRTEVTAGGPLRSEMMMGAYDDFIEYALQDRWEPLVYDSGYELPIPPKVVPGSQAVQIQADRPNRNERTLRSNGNPILGSGTPVVLTGLMRGVTYVMQGTRLTATGIDTRNYNVKVISAVSNAVVIAPATPTDQMPPPTDYVLVFRLAATTVLKEVAVVPPSSGVGAVIPGNFSGYNIGDTVDIRSYTRFAAPNGDDLTRVVAVVQEITGTTSATFVPKKGEKSIPLGVRNVLLARQSKTFSNASLSLATKSLRGPDFSEFEQPSSVAALWMKVEEMDGSGGVAAWTLGRLKRNAVGAITPSFSNPGTGLVSPVYGSGAAGVQIQAAPLPSQRNVSIVTPGAENFSTFLVADKRYWVRLRNASGENLRWDAGTASYQNTGTPSLYQVQVVRFNTTTDVTLAPVPNYQFFEPGGGQTNLEIIFEEVGTELSFDVLDLQGFTTSGATRSYRFTLASTVENGTDKRTACFERRYEDVDDGEDVVGSHYAYIRKQGLNSLTWNVTRSAVTIDMDWSGGEELKTVKGESGRYATRILKPIVNSIIDGIEGKTGMIEGPDGSSADFCATEISLSVGNNLRPVNKLFKRTAETVSSGTVAITGNIKGLYDNSNAYDRYLAFEKSSFAFPMIDILDQRGYVVEVLACRFTDGNRNPQGVNTDIIKDFSFSGEINDDIGKTIRIWRFQ